MGFFAQVNGTGSFKTRADRRGSYLLQQLSTTLFRVLLWSCETCCGGTACFCALANEMVCAETSVAVDHGRTTSIR
jgi:hypothetical protein